MHGSISEWLSLYSSHNSDDQLSPNTCLMRMEDAPCADADSFIAVVVQREMGVRNYLRVAPLFETLDDLHNSKQAMTDLFSVPWYLKHINGEQECMIGYSDSGKDAGRMAAAWGLYEVQVCYQPQPGSKEFKTRCWQQTRLIGWHSFQIKQCH